MKIERIELRKIHLAYVSPFETSGWRELGREPVIVRIDAERHHGLGRGTGGHPAVLQRRVDRYGAGSLPGSISRPC